MDPFEKEQVWFDFLQLFEKLYRIPVELDGFFVSKTFGILKKEKKREMDGSLKVSEVF